MTNNFKTAKARQQLFWRQTNNINDYLFFDIKKQKPHLRRTFTKKSDFEDRIPCGMLSLINYTKINKRFCQSYLTKKQAFNKLFFA